jgi:hypothetical protein
MQTTVNPSRDHPRCDAMDGDELSAEQLSRAYVLPANAGPAMIQ